MVKIKMRQMAAVAAVGVSLLGGTAFASHAKGYDWAYRVNEGRVSDAILAYEVPDTDMQPLNLLCEEGGQRIFVNVIGGSPDLRSIGLKAGTQGKTLSGQSELHSEVGESHFTSSEISSADPLIVEFARSGQLTVEMKDREHVLDGGPEARSTVQRFVRFCQG